MNWEKIKLGIKTEKKFKEDLKKSLIEDEDYFMNYQFSELRDSISPRELFKQKLKSKLILKHKRKSRIYSFALKSIALTSLAFLFFLIISTKSPETIAFRETNIDSFYGNVRVTQENQNYKINHENFGIVNNARITTENNSYATISFFEDSVIRIEENTSIEIKSLKPSDIAQDIGRVVIKINHGKIWVKSSAVDSYSSNFNVFTKDINLILAPNASVDISVKNNNFEQVRVWDENIKIVTNKDEISVFNGDKINKDNIIRKIDFNEYQTDWVQDNIKKDQYFINKFFGSYFEKQLKISNVFESINFDKEKPEEIVKKINGNYFFIMNEIINQESYNVNTLIVNFYEDFINFDKKYHKEALLTLTSIEKKFQYFYLEHDLNKIDKVLFDIRNDIEKNNEIVKQEKILTKKIERVKILAKQGNKKRAEKELKTIAETKKNDKVKTKNKKDVEKILRERKKQLLDLKNIENLGMQKDTVQKVVEKTEEDTYVLTRPGFPNKNNKITSKKIIDNVNVYSSAKGKRNTLVNMLKNVDDKKENIGMLIEIKGEIPEEFKHLIDRKIMNIMD